MCVCVCACVCVCVRACYAVGWPMKCAIAVSLLKLVITFMVYVNVHCVNVNYYIAI